MDIKEITTSVTISILLYLVLTVLVSFLSLTVHSSKYIKESYFDREGEHILNQKIDPEYPGDEKIKEAKLIYYSISIGQASEISDLNLEDINIFPLYSISLILIANLLGLYLFYNKELK